MILNKDGSYAAHTHKHTQYNLMHSSEQCQWAALTFSPRIIMCRLSSWTSTSASSFRMLSAPPAGARPISSQKSTCNSCFPGAWKITNTKRTWLFWNITLCHWMNGSRHYEGHKCFHYDPWTCQKKIHPMAQHHIPEEWNPQQYCCENLNLD